MRTYTTLDNEVLDLSTLGPAERAYFERCYAAYRDGVDWIAFTRLVTGPENPILEPGSRVTRAVLDSPLFRALQDLEARLGILQGAIRPTSGDDVARDPLADAYVSVSEAAARKHVGERAVYSAIERGSVIAVREGRSTRISENSLRHWHVSEVRQQAGKARVAAD